MRTISFESIPSIAIFVRHSDNCDHKGNETFKGCKCPKHFRYTLDGKQVRQSAKTRFWKTAEERRRALEASFGASGGKPVKVEAESRKTIQRLIETFLQDKRTSGVNDKTVSRYKRELERFEEFMGSRSKYLPHEITGEDLSDYRAGWAELYPAANTRKIVQERLRGFLRWCFDHRVIDRVPKMAAIKVNRPPTLPLTNEQWDALLTSICTLFTGEKAIRARALVRLMRFTGLAIHDAVTLKRAELVQDGPLYRVVTSRQKTGTHVSVPIPPDVAAEVIAAQELNQSKTYIFWNTGEGKPDTAVTHWQSVLRRAFRDAGMLTGHPHQLRDTFAVSLLSAGVPLEEVSKLLGHKSIKTTEDHYAPWIQSRQSRLDALVQATW